MSKNYRAELTGVFGDPVDGNPTGAMEEAAYTHCRLNYRYLTVRVLPEDLPAAMTAVRVMHMKGINLTMPHKIAVISLLDEISPAAGIIGAVNTVIVREDGTLCGENTDGKGFVEALLRSGETAAGKNITLLGAGGAARAIAVECALAGSRKITVVNRSTARGQELAQLIETHTNCKACALPWTTKFRLPADTELLIQATPIGLYPKITDIPDVDMNSDTDQMIVCDVVFNPAVTRFLREAGNRGARTISGLGMLACQGARNFTLWTGIEAPLDVMEHQLRLEFAQEDS